MSGEAALPEGLYTAWSEDSLRAAGYTLAEVRDAPDRPGWEWVFIARKPGQ